MSGWKFGAVGLGFRGLGFRGLGPRARGLGGCSQELGKHTAHDPHSLCAVFLVR